MNIFQKIKQFFSNIGNKPKLLESPKNVQEEINYTQNSSQDKSNFLEELKYDTNDFLDPKVCKGDDFIPNILRTLGTNEDIIKNPMLMSEIETHFFAIINRSGLKMCDFYENPTREQNEKTVNIIKRNKVLNDKERNAEYKKVESVSPQRLYYGLNIDKETGNLTTQTLVYSKDKKSTEFSSNNYKETTFLADGKGNAIVSRIYSKIDDNKVENLSNTSKTLYNSDGIEMQSETRCYGQVNGESKINYHRRAKRDSEYPFIVQEQILVDDISSDKFTGIRYMAIEIKDLAQIYTPEYQEDKKGKNVPIVFNSREQISEYYQENKGTIDNALEQEPTYGLFPSKQLKKSLKTGIRTLFEDAGILSKEQQAEKEAIK